jgi:guanine deaminase
MSTPFMAIAIAEARRGIRSGDGGPFGAVVVRDGVVVARAHNQVVRANDPTAHAEMQAIRAACRTLGTFDLSGCTIYTTCEPCPMCFAAIHWARIDGVVYGASRADAAAVGFDDAAIYDVLAAERSPAFGISAGVEAEACRAVMAAWSLSEARVPY